MVIKKKSKKILKKRCKNAILLDLGNGSTIILNDMPHFYCDKCKASFQPRKNVKIDRKVIQGHKYILKSKHICGTECIRLLTPEMIDSKIKRKSSKIFTRR